jgi:molecular chaperone Hsp33
MKQADHLYRFLFEHQNIRGEFIQLEDTWRDVLARADYPAPLRAVLGEAMAAAALLVATLKVDGSLTMQVRGSGPMHLLVVQAYSDGSIRGLARWSGEVSPGSLASLSGSGQLVMTIDPREGERYQGIVPLAGEHLHDALGHYFDQSEQLPTRLWLSASDETAAGLLLQALPGERQDDDSWNRVLHLGETVTGAELRSLDVETLLRRLYHEETLRLFDPSPVRFQCSCSREKIINMLRQLGEHEMNGIIAERGRIDVDCEFCGKGYRFDSVDVHALFATNDYPLESKTVQ